MISRRDFLKKISVLGASTACFTPSLPGLQTSMRPSLKSLLDSDYPFPYDSDYFEASERVVFIDPLQTSVNIFPKEGKSLDIKFYISQEDRFRLCRYKIFNYTGVDASLEIPFSNLFRDPFFTYRIEYREMHEGSWKSTPERTVKTPSVSLEDKELEVILIGDDHVPDDADIPGNPLQDKHLRNLRLRGDSVNYFLKKMAVNPAYFPQGEELHLMNAFCMASTVYHILRHENPDFIVDLGDHYGGFGHKWEGLGLKNQHAVTDEERDQYVRMFRIATRKIFSALSPTIPVYWVLGNHDGESGWLRTREPGTKYRKTFFKQPGESSGGSPDENYYSLVWGAGESSYWLKGQNKGGAQFIVLDCMGYNPRQPGHPEDWTLGNRQMGWLEQTLRYEADWKFVLFHHVLGGWPAGSNEKEKNYAYGRGPLFSAEDYRDFVDDPNLIEQVHLTQLMADSGVDFGIYGHDHIFSTEEIETPRTGRKLYGMCVGTPKHIGELAWYLGDYWKHYYGDYGKYWGLAEKADFWGPSGYTKLTIKKDSLKIDYIRSAINHPYTNIPPAVAVGDVVQSVLI
jgi:hypothetical protein